MNNSAQVISALLVIIPLVIGGAGLAYYLGLLLVRSLRAPRQEHCQPRQVQREGKEMNLSLTGALGTLKDTYKRATSAYVELWEWEEQERQREALREEMGDLPQLHPQPHSRAGSLPVPAPRPMSSP